MTFKSSLSETGWIFSFCECCGGGLDPVACDIFHLVE